MQSRAILTSCRHTRSRISWCGPPKPNWTSYPSLKSSFLRECKIMLSSAWRSSSQVFWTRIFLFGATCVVGLIVARKRKLRRLHLHILHSKRTVRDDFGKYFGLDIGGSLGKMVFMEIPIASLQSSQLQQQQQQQSQQQHSSYSHGTTTKELLNLQLLQDKLLNEVQDASCFAARFANLQREDRLRLVLDPETSETIPEGGVLHFLSFPTSKLHEVVEFIRNHFLHRFLCKLSCTGGGAFKFSRLFEEQLGISIQKRDEMDCLIKGLAFVVQHADQEVYSYRNPPETTSPPPEEKELEDQAPQGSSEEAALSDASEPEVAELVDSAETETDSATAEHSQANHHEEHDEEEDEFVRHHDYSYRVFFPTLEEDQLYPFLLVNIGSGVSILKVSSASDYERVSGSSLGGGTFFGLCRLLGNFSTFEESMEATRQGYASRVDMTVGDIYGQAYDLFNLKSNTIASSFGKMGFTPFSNVTAEDCAKSCLLMISLNLAQVAYLNAKRVETDRIFFCGNFLRNNDLAARYLAMAIDYWSGSTMEAQFFQHEGFFGAVGAFLISHAWKQQQTSQPKTQSRPKTVEVQ